MYVQILHMGGERVYMGKRWLDHHFPPLISATEDNLTRALHATLTLGSGSPALEKMYAMAHAAFFLWHFGAWQWVAVKR